MGLLSSAPEGAADPVSVDDDASDTSQEDSTPAPEAPKQETVLLPKNRREAMHQEKVEYQQKVLALEETVAKQTQEHRQAMSEYQQQIARMLGNLEAKTQAAQQPAQPQANPQQLYDAAREALDRGDFSGYQRKFAEAVRSEVVAAMPRPQAQAAPQGIDPRLQAVIMSTPAAGKVMGHEKGVMLAQIKDQELNVMGVPDGPERWRKAFELAEQSLYGGQSSPASYSTQSRGALSGIPTSRGSAASPAQPSINLPGNWKQWADAAGMSKDEYAKFYAEAHPEAIKDE